MKGQGGGRCGSGTGWRWWWKGVEGVLRKEGDVVVMEVKV